MKLNTNVRPTYRDVVMVARMVAQMSENPTYIFETDPGEFAVVPGVDLATALLQARTEHPAARLVETVRLGRRRSAPRTIDLSE